VPITFGKQADALAERTRRTISMSTRLGVRMKTMAAALMIMAAGDLRPGGIEALRWEKRPVLVFATAGDPRIDRQLTLFRQNAADMVERRNVVVVDTGEGGSLRARFAPSGFTVVLVGLDGGEKFRTTEVVSPDTLEGLIDGMPMRQREQGRDEAA
jgi:hypothetical protein